MLETSPAPPTAAPDFSMPLEEAMRTQRAIRRLKPDPVDDGLVLRVIELALKAPTGSNAQNWEFVMVKDPAVKERLGALNRGAFRIYGALGRWTARNDPRLPARAPPPLPAHRGHQLLWLDLALGAEPAAGRPRRRARRGAHHAATVEHVPRAPRARAPVDRHALRRRAARLAARPLRADHAPPGRRGRAPRPVREPAVPARLHRRLTPGQNTKENQAWRAVLASSPLFVGFGGSW